MPSRSNLHLLPIIKGLAVIQIRKRRINQLFNQIMVGLVNQNSVVDKTVINPSRQLVVLGKKAQRTWQTNLTKSQKIIIMNFHQIVSQNHLLLVTTQCKTLKKRKSHSRRKNNLRHLCWKCLVALRKNRESTLWQLKLKVHPKNTCKEREAPYSKRQLRWTNWINLLHLYLKRMKVIQRRFCSFCKNLSWRSTWHKKIT